MKIPLCPNCKIRKIETWQSKKRGLRILRLCKECDRLETQQMMNNIRI